MDTQAQKDNLIQWLSDLKDQKTIDLIESIKLSEINEMKVSISSDQKRAIEDGLKSIEKGKIKSHEWVQSETKSRYPNLFD